MPLLIIVISMTFFIAHIIYPLYFKSIKPDSIYCTTFQKMLAKIIFGGIEWKISNKNCICRLEFFFSC